MLNEFIINNNVTIIKTFGIVLIILITLVVILLIKQYSLKRRIQVLESFETVFYLLQKLVNKEKQPEDTTKAEEEKGSMARLKKITTTYQKLNRGLELTKEEQEIYEDAINGK